MAVSGTDNDSQMRALLLHCAGPDVQDIFMHLENVGTTGKAAMDALNNHFTMLHLRGMYFVKLFKRQISRRLILSQDFVNLPPRMKLPIRIPESRIISLISARLIA